MLRGKRVWIVLAIVLVLLAGGVFGVRWALRPDNLARVITGWVDRELGAQLSLAEGPGLRLIPRLQLSLAGVRLERAGALIASAEELRVALPWSSLWHGGLSVESLSIRRPTIAWPQLTALLRELSDPNAPTRAPTLPQIAVGVRVEDGTLLSGSDENAWHLDQLSLVTTPLTNGEVFHLDAGARIRGQQSRALSLSLRARPGQGDADLSFDDIAARLMVSPDQQPLDSGMTVDVLGSLRLDQTGLATADLSGQLPGWPDWLPNALGFAGQQPIALRVQRLADADVVAIELKQDGHNLSAELTTSDLATAIDQIDEPLAAFASLRGRWQLDALDMGDLHIEGIQIEVAPYSAANAQADSAADTGR